MKETITLEHDKHIHNVQNLGKIHIDECRAAITLGNILRDGHAECVRNSLKFNEIILIKLFISH